MAYGTDTRVPVIFGANPGDLWQDGRRSSWDLFYFSMYWRQNETEFSLGPDGIVDEKDLQELIRLLHQK